jgi:hypothetical protein
VLSLVADAVVPLITVRALAKVSASALPQSSFAGPRVVRVMLRLPDPVWLLEYPSTTIQ